MRDSIERLENTVQRLENTVQRLESTLNQQQVTIGNTLEIAARAEIAKRHGSRFAENFGVGDTLNGAVVAH